MICIFILFLEIQLIKHYLLSSYLFTSQLQNQLQAQLQAAASKGKQANITPEMIQVSLLIIHEMIFDHITLYKYYLSM